MSPRVVPAIDSSTIVLPTADELYDRLMAEIDPELTSASLPTLQGKYRDETPEDAKVRAARYETAFKEYDRKLKGYIGGIERKIVAAHQKALESLEREEQGKEAQTLLNLESSIQNL